MARRKRRWLVRHGEWYIVKRERSDKLYRAWTNPKTGREERTSLGTSDLQQAEQKLVEWLAAQYRPKNAETKDVPLSWIFLNYYEEHASKLPSKTSAKTALKYWVDWWGEAVISDISQPRQKQFVEWLRSTGKSDGYIQRILVSGRAAVQRAYKHGIIQSAPFIMNVQTQEDVRNSEPKGRPLDIKEMAALFEAAEQDHIWRFLLLAVNTLARPNAILTLNGHMISFQDSFINLLPPGEKQTKKRKPIIPITKTIWPWLYAWGGADGFVTYKGPIKSIKTAWRNLRKDAGFDSSVNPYSIRHTMARELRKRRVLGEEISIMLGHKPVYESDTTLLYSPYDPDYCQRAVEAIDEYCLELNGHLKRRKIWHPPLLPTYFPPRETGEALSP